MASEVSVIGQLPVELHQSLLDRLATHSHGSQAFTTREVVFERGQTPSPGACKHAY